MKRQNKKANKRNLNDGQHKMYRKQIKQFDKMERQRARDNYAEFNDTKNTPTNDMAWYSGNPAAIDAATRLINHYAAGAPFYKSLKGADVTLQRKAIPGVMAFTTVPVLGSTSSSSDAINLAAHRIYTKIRFENTGAKNYEAADLMMYLLALNSVYAAYSHICRIFTTMNLYDTMNRYLPDALLQAMGVTANGVRSIRTNAANFHSWLINVAARINVYKTPADFPLYRRTAWLYSNVFKDSPELKAQMYLFKPEHCFKWIEKVDAIPTEKNFYLSSNPVPTFDNYNQIVTYMEALLTALYTSEDFSIMNGDILKVYGNNVYTVSAPDKTELLIPVHGNSESMQIENARIIHLISECDPSIYVERDSGLIHQAIFADGIYAKVGYVMNYHTELPSTEEYTESTRLCPIFQKFDDGTSKLYAAGDVILTSAAIYYLYYADNGEVSTVSSTYFSMVEDDRSVVAMTDINAFDKHPTFYYYNEETEAITGVNCQFDNPTILDDESIAGIHRACLYSLFGVYNS